MRCAPGEDGTNGFFVSCFVRRASLLTSEETLSSGKRKARVELDDHIDTDTPAFKRAEKERRKKRTKQRYKESSG